MRCTWYSLVMKMLLNSPVCSAKHAAALRCCCTPPGCARITAATSTLFPKSCAHMLRLPASRAILVGGVSMTGAGCTAGPPRPSALPPPYSPPLKSILGCVITIRGEAAGSFPFLGTAPAFVPAAEGPLPPPPAWSSLWSWLPSTHTRSPSSAATYDVMMYSTISIDVMMYSTIRVDVMMYSTISIERTLTQSQQGTIYHERAI